MRNKNHGRSAQGDLVQSVGEDDEGSIEMLSRASSFAASTGGARDFKPIPVLPERTAKKHEQKTVFQNLVSWVLTNIVLVQPEDEFQQTLRKITLTLMIICTPYILFYIGYWIFIFRGEVALIVQAVNLSIFQVVFTINYIILRRRKHVTDLQQEFQTWVLILGWVITAIAVPEYDVRGVVYATALMCSLAGTRSFMWQMLALYGIAWLSAINDGFWSGADASPQPSVTGYTFLVLPDARRGPAVEKIVNIGTSITVCFTAILGVKAQALVNVQFLNKSQTTNRVAGEVVQWLRKYDTEKVKEILESDESDSMDADFLAAFKAMNANLETYRPFLPNYLFLESDEDGINDEDDEEGDILSLGGSPLARDESTGGTFSKNNSMNRSSMTSYVYTKRMKQKNLKPTALDSSSQSSKSSRRSLSISGSVQKVGGKLPQQHHQLVQHGRGDGFCNVKVCYALVHIKANLDSWLNNNNGRIIGQQDHNNSDSQGIGGADLTSERSYSQHDVVRVLGTFVDTIYQEAIQTRASVHSMLGDTVQLTWNATNSVVQPETKASQFLLRLKKKANTLQPQGLPIAAALASGRSIVYNVVSPATKQQSLVLDAPWLQALNGCYDLARRTCSLVADETTQRAAQFHVNFTGVDEVMYVSGEQNDSAGCSIDQPASIYPGQRFFLRCDAPNPAGVLNPSHYSLASKMLFEIKSEREVSETEEWMYQLQDSSPESTGDARAVAFCSALTRAIEYDALSSVIVGGKGGSISVNSGSSPTTLSPSTSASLSNIQIHQRNTDNRHSTLGGPPSEAAAREALTLLKEAGINPNTENASSYTSLEKRFVRYCLGSAASSSGKSSA